MYTKNFCNTFPIRQKRKRVKESERFRCIFIYFCIIWTPVAKRVWVCIGEEIWFSIPKRRHRSNEMVYSGIWVSSTWAEHKHIVYTIVAQLTVAEHQQLWQATEMIWKLKHSKSVVWCANRAVFSVLHIQHNKYDVST